MHEIETYDNGEAGFVGNRIPGWHMLGTTYTGADRLDLQTAMKIAHLNDWDVRLTTDMIVIDPKTGDPIRTDNWALTLRNNPVDPNAPAQPLGMVSSDYKPVQNEEAFAFGEAMIQEGLEVETMGSLRDGKQVFALFRFPKDVNIGGDVVYPYVHVNTSHDGSMAVTAGLTGVRIVCANTQAMALDAPTPRIRIPHFGNGLEGQLEAAKLAIRDAAQGVTDFEQDMTIWTNTKVTPAQVDKVILRKFPQPKDGNVLAKMTADANAAALRYLYEEAETNKALRGTAWGLAQAMLEWQDWARGRNTGKNRARSQVSSLADTMRREAFTIIRQEVPALVR